ncbi:MAG: calcium-binding protein, partial [Aquihabitans sp.]
MATIAGVGVLAAAPPAGALVTVATSGTTMTVTLTGTETLDVSCVGGVVSANTKTGSPAIPCSTFSKLIVNGDSAAQTIDGHDLEIPAFTAKPVLVADLGDGVDLVDPTSRADDIDMGPGNDRVYFERSVTDVLLDGGAGTDTIGIYGEDGVNDNFVGTSNNTNLTITHEVGGVVRTDTAKNFEAIDGAARSGNDTLDFSGITTVSSIKDVNLFGGEGDDVVRGPQFAGDLFAGPGNNQIFGGPGNDNIGSEGNGDVIKGGGGTGDHISDRNSGRSGRTIDNLGQSNWYFFEGTLGDTVTRVRPGPSGGTIVTNSLTRTGQQVLGTSFKNVASQFLVNTSGQAKGMVDLVALDSSRKIYATGDSAKDDLA